MNRIFKNLKDDGVQIQAEYRKNLEKSYKKKWLQGYRQAIVNALEWIKEYRGGCANELLSLSDHLYNIYKLKYNMVHL